MEGHAVGVEGVAIESKHLSHGLGPAIFDEVEKESLVGTVEFVANNVMTYVLCVHADLMLSAGDRLHASERVAAVSIEWREAGLRFLASTVAFDGGLATYDTLRVGTDWGVDEDFSIEMAFENRDVKLVHLAPFESHLQLPRL